MVRNILMVTQNLTITSSAQNAGKVEDIFMEELQINKIAQDHFDGIIKGHQTYYYGICPKCNKKD